MVLLIRHGQFATRRSSVHCSIAVMVQTHGLRGFVGGPWEVLLQNIDPLAGAHFVLPGGAGVGLLNDRVLGALGGLPGLSCGSTSRNVASDSGPKLVTVRTARLGYEHRWHGWFLGPIKMIVFIAVAVVVSSSHSN